MGCFMCGSSHSNGEIKLHRCGVGYNHKRQYVGALKNILAFIEGDRHMDDDSGYKYARGGLNSMCSELQEQFEFENSPQHQRVAAESAAAEAAAKPTKRPKRPKHS